MLLILVIEDLKRHPDLLVKETDSLNITVILLASLTAELRERAKKGDFDNLLQSELSEKKPQSHAETPVDASLPVDDVLSDARNVQAKTPVPTDLTFDEEMRLAIERSKAEISKANDVLDNIPDIGKQENKHLNFLEGTEIGHSKYLKRNGEIESDLRVLGGGEENIDAELAMVLERSKYDTHGGRGLKYDTHQGGGVADRDCMDIESQPRPLMQYHCSEGGSLHYPSSGGKSRENHANSYRPKINRKQTLSRSSPLKQNVNVNFASETVNSMSANVVQLNNLNSSRDCVKTATDCHQPLNKNFRDTCTKTIQNTHSDAIWDDGTVGTDRLSYESNGENKNPAKRKYYKKDLVFKPDETCVEESYSSNSDNETWHKKKPKTTQFSFTPARECIEKNVLQASFSKGLHDRGHQSPGNKLGKVYKMRKVKDEVLHSIETDPSLSNSKKVKVKIETECCENIEKLNSIPNLDGSGQTNGYNSGDDLFADTDDKSENHNESLEENVDPCLNLSSLLERSASYGVKKSWNDRVKNYFDDVSETRRVSSVEDVSVLNVISGSVETGDRSGDLSLSQGSDSGESLPDIGLYITTPAGNACFTDSSVRVKTNSRDASPTRNLHIAGGSVSSKDKSYRTAEMNSKRIKGNVDVGGRQNRFDSGYDSDTPCHVYNDENEDKVNLVLSVLPHLARNVAREVLKKCNNNVDLCITEILEGGG